MLYIWWGNLMLALLWSSGHWGEKQVSSAEWFSADRFQFDAWCPSLDVQRQQVTTRPLFSVFIFFFPLSQAPARFSYSSIASLYMAGSTSSAHCSREVCLAMWPCQEEINVQTCKGCAVWRTEIPPPSVSVCTSLLFSWGLQYLKWTCHLHTSANRSEAWEYVVCN